MTNKDDEHHTSVTSARCMLTSAVSAIRSSAALEVDPEDTTVDEPLIQTRRDSASTAVLAPLSGLCRPLSEGRQQKNRPSLLNCVVRERRGSISESDLLAVQVGHSALDCTPRLSDSVSTSTAQPQVEGKLHLVY